MQKEKTNESVPGRDAVEIVDAMSVGIHNAMSGKIVGNYEGNYEGDDCDVPDEMEEVEDDGSLDV